jgi:hypothetical protein
VARFVADSRGLSGRMDSRFRGNDAHPCLSHSAIGDGFPPAWECSQERQGKLSAPTRHSRERGNPGVAGEMDSRVRGNDRGCRE